MPTATPGRPLTAVEFLELPEREGLRQELVEGELVVHGPDLDHQFAVGHLYAALHGWCHAAPDRGFVILDVDTGLDDRNVLLPDLQWYAAGRTLGERPQPLADIVVEVRSPTTWHRDVGVKRRLYELHGAHEYWLVDVVARSIIRLHRDAPDGATFDRSVELTGDEALGTPLLPGFALPASEVFARPDRPAG